MPCCDRAQRSHVGRLPKQMNRHNGARLAGHDRLFHPRGVEQQRIRVHIHERHAKTAVERRGGTRDERVVRYDDFAPVIKAVVVKERGQGKAQCVRPVREQQAISATTERRPLLGEFLRQRLRQTFHTTEEDPAKTPPNAAIPAGEATVPLGCPWPNPGIAHRYPALLGQRTGDAGGGPWQTANSSSSDRAQQRLCFGK